MKGIVAVVGRPNVGKSTFFNRIAGSRVSIVDDTPGVTRDRIYFETDWNGREIIMIDTGGIEPVSDNLILKQMRLQAEMAIASADVIIFMTEIHTGVTADDRDIATMLKKSKKPVVLAVNKVDGVGDVPPEFYEFYELGMGDPIALSSVHGTGTGDLLDAAFEHIDFSEFGTNMIPDSTVSQFENNIYDLVELCTKVLSDNPLFFLINSYTTGISGEVLSNILKITPTFYDDLIPYEGMIPSPDNTVLIIDTKDNRKEFAFSDWTATPVVRKRNLLVTSFTYNGYTQEFISPSNADDLPTTLSPDKAYKKLLALKSTYPEGMRYTDNEVYTTSYDNRLAIGYGCHGFALQISDDVFETARYTRTSNFTMDDIKPGVIVRIQNDTHTVVVLEKKENTVVIVEGNYYGTVHWGRELSHSEILGGNYIITRY